MIPAINTAVLALGTLLFAAFYVYSVQPAKLEERVGEVAYARVLLWSAIAIRSHSSFLVLYSLAWIPIYWIACRVEEADLVLRYGRDYEEYQERVGTFLPRFRRKLPWGGGA